MADCRCALLKASSSKLKPAVDQAAEEPGVRFLESLRLHGDQRVEKVKAYGSNGVHHLSLNDPRQRIKQQRPGASWPPNIT